jgi:hypothetical protein
MERTRNWNLGEVSERLNNMYKKFKKQAKREEDQAAAERRMQDIQWDDGTGY